MHDLATIITPDMVESMLWNVTDNTDTDSETFDCMTFWFHDGSYLGTCSTGRGFSQWGDGSYNDEFEDTLTDWSSLPDTLKNHVIGRVREGYRDFIAEHADTAPDILRNLIMGDYE